MKPTKVAIERAKKRVRDQHRQLAAVPLPLWTLTSERDDANALHWTLIADGKIVSSWPEHNAPGLGEYLNTVLGAWTGAWHLARDQRNLLAKKIEGGIQAGRRSARRDRATVEQLIRACLGRGEDPSGYAAEWAKEYSYSARQIRNIIAKVRAE